MGLVHGTNRYEEASTAPRIHRCRGSSALIWKLGVPPSSPMADNGGVVTSQPRMVSSQPRMVSSPPRMVSSLPRTVSAPPRMVSSPPRMESINQILTDNSNSQLHALENAPGGQAVSNDYAPPPGDGGKGLLSNNNVGQTSDYMLVPGSNPNQPQRTSLIIVTDHQQGKTKVLKVVKRETSRTSQNSTTPFQSPCSKETDICPYCEQCRCPKCKLADETVGKLILNERCWCTPQTVLDTTTCFCCVRCSFYHCLANGNDVDENAFVDEPCSCHHKKCCLRWSAIGVMSLLFPCLLCYLPGKACLSCCRKCSTHRETGCKCKRTIYNGML